jgi:hypothetical protein
MSEPVKVTVSDPVTGEVLAEKVIDNDYVVVVAGARYVSGTQVAGRTHTVTIKDWRPRPAPLPGDTK